MGLCLIPRAEILQDGRGELKGSGGRRRPPAAVLLTASTLSRFHHPRLVTRCGEGTEEAAEAGEPFLLSLMLHVLDAYRRFTLHANRQKARYISDYPYTSGRGPTA